MRITSSVYLIPMHGSRSVREIGGILLFAIMCLCSQSSSALEPVTLQLKWKHQFQFAGYYAAVEKGFYREAGFDVTIREADVSKTTLDVVLDGDAEFGVAASDLVLAFGKGASVVALAPIIQHSPLTLLVSGNAGVETIHDLVGKRVMIHPEEAELFAYFEAEGLPLSKMELVPNTFSTDALLNGQVHALSGYSTDEPFLLHEHGFRFLQFSPRAGGIDFYGDTLFTTRKLVDRDPLIVHNFVEASLKGWRFAFDHPEEMADIILAKYSQRHSREHLLFEAEETRKLAQPDLIEIGYVNPGRWHQIAETYAQLGMMPEVPELQTFIYDQNQLPDVRIFSLALAASLLVTTIVLIVATRFYYLSVTVQRQAETLQTALDGLRALHGIIPICSYCKKVRDECGAWGEMEEYVRDNYDATFSHGICTECYEKLSDEIESIRSEDRDITS